MDRNKLIFWRKVFRPVFVRLEMVIFNCGSVSSVRSGNFVLAKIEGGLEQARGNQGGDPLVKKSSCLFFSLFLQSKFLQIVVEIGQSMCRPPLLQAFCSFAL